MATQRDLSPPEYPNKFPIVLAELKNQNEQYKTDVLDWEVQHQITRNKWVEELSLLNKQASEGRVVESLRWLATDRQMEQLTIDGLRIKSVKATLTDRINFLAADLLGLFPAIMQDYITNYISRQQLINYLNSYKDLIASGNNLPCYTEGSAAESIRAAIKEYLQGTKAIKN